MVFINGGPTKGGVLIATGPDLYDGGNETAAFNSADD